MFLSLESISRLFFFEFSIFSFREFLVIIARAELELLLDFTSQLSRVVLDDPNRLAESALLRSSSVVELLGCSFSWSRKSPKNRTIASSASLQLRRRRSASMENSSRKYLTLMSLLRPRLRGSNRKRMPVCVRQVARFSISNYSSSSTSSPRSNSHRSTVSGAYSQQKWNRPSPPCSQWCNPTRYSLSRLPRKPAIFFRISSSRSEWKTSFLCTSTRSSSPTDSFNCPKGYPSPSISTLKNPCSCAFIIELLLLAIWLQLSRTPRANGNRQACDRKD